MWRRKSATNFFLFRWNLVRMHLASKNTNHNGFRGQCRVPYNWRTTRGLGFAMDVTTAHSVRQLSSVGVVRFHGVVSPNRVRVWIPSGARLSHDLLSVTWAWEEWGWFHVFQPNNIYPYQLDAFKFQVRTSRNITFATNHNSHKREDKARALRWQLTCLSALSITLGNEYTQYLAWQITGYCCR